MIGSHGIEIVAGRETPFDELLRVADETVEAGYRVAVTEIVDLRLRVKKVV